MSSCFSRFAYGNNVSVYTNIRNSAVLYPLWSSAHRFGTWDEFCSCFALAITNILRSSPPYYIFKSTWTYGCMVNQSGQLFVSGWALVTCCSLCIYLPWIWTWPHGGAHCHLYCDSWRSLGKAFSRHPEKTKENVLNLIKFQFNNSELIWLCWVIRRNKTVLVINHRNYTRKVEFWQRIGIE